MDKIKGEAEEGFIVKANNVCIAIK